MDDSEEVLEYQRMDHQAVNERFVDDLIAGGPIGPRVVDIGCGTAAIPVLLAQRVDDIEVLGIDSSTEMLDVARVEIELGSVVGRVYLEHCDCKNLEGFETGVVDTVISNTMLHHVAEPNRVLAEAMKLLAPSGRLFIRDLLRPVDEPTLEKLVEQHAGGESDYAKQLLRQSLHAALDLPEIRGIVAELGIDPECIRQTSDRHWTLDWTCPPASEA